MEHCSARLKRSGRIGDNVTMTEENRISELTRISRERALTPEETAERLAPARGISGRLAARHAGNARKRLHHRVRDGKEHSPKKKF